MIYPFDASYAQKVLRIHYEYAGVIVRKRERLAAKACGKGNRINRSRQNTCGR